MPSPNEFPRHSRALALASAAFGLAFVATLPAQAQSRHICWVQSVRAADDGVEVRLSEPRSVDFTRVAVKFGVHTATVDLLHGHDGDLYFIRDLPETQCVMQVVAHGARRGLEVRANYRWPGSGKLGSYDVEYMPAG